MSASPREGNIEPSGSNPHDTPLKKYEATIKPIQFGQTHLHTLPVQLFPIPLYPYLCWNLQRRSRPGWNLCGLSSNQNTKLQGMVFFYPWNPWDERYIYLQLYSWLICMAKVSKHTNPMDPMGYILAIIKSWLVNTCDLLIVSCDVAWHFQPCSI